MLLTIQKTTYINYMNQIAQLRETDKKLYLNSHKKIMYELQAELLMDAPLPFMKYCPTNMRF